MKASTNSQGVKEVAFTGKLVSPISEQRWTNKNGKEYGLATIEADLGGKKRILTAIIYSKNIAYGVSVGNSYACKAVFLNGADQDPLIQMSHLGQAAKATAADFAAAFEQESEVPVEKLKA